MIDPSDKYALYCEIYACTECDGMGAYEDEGYGEHTCKRCGGSGLDPDAPEYEGPDPI